jgi:hypothetical protein
VNSGATIVGDEAAQHRLSELSHRAQDLAPAWSRVLPRLRQEEALIFASHGRGRWPANRPGTIRQKGRNEPNVDQGRLLRALTQPRALGARAVTGKTQMRFGVNDQRGFWSRFVGKARPFIVDEKTAERIGTRAVRDCLDGAA